MVSERVRIYEVGPRDGLQNEAAAIPTATKARFIELLADAGLREIEATSFVAPTAIPQLADADALLGALPTAAGRPLPGPRPEPARPGPSRGGRRRRDRRLHRGDRRLHPGQHRDDRRRVARGRSRRSWPAPPSSAGGGAATSRPRSAARTPGGSIRPRAVEVARRLARARGRRGLLRRHDRRRRAGAGRGADGAGRRPRASRSSGSPSTSTTRAARRWPTSPPGWTPGSAASTRRPAGPAAARTPRAPPAISPRRTSSTSSTPPAGSTASRLEGVLEAARFIAGALGRPLATKVGQAGGWDPRPAAATGIGA